MRTVVAALALAFLAALQLVAGLRSPVAAAALQRRGRLLSAAKKPLPPPPAAPEKKGELGFNLQSARRITRWIMFPGESGSTKWRAGLPALRITLRAFTSSQLRSTVQIASAPPETPKSAPRQLTYPTPTPISISTPALRAGIFKDFDSTEERMKPTVVVKPKTLSKREKEYMSVRYSDRGLEPEDKPSLWDKLQGR